MSLKALELSSIISPITTLLVNYPDLNSLLQDALSVSEEWLIGNFLSVGDSRYSKTSSNNIWYVCK